MEIIFSAILPLLAFFAAIAFVLSIFGMMAGVRAIGETWALQMVLVLVTIGATVLPAAIRISSGLDTDNPLILTNATDQIGVLVWAKRAITAATLTIVFAGLMRVFRRVGSTHEARRPMLREYLFFVFSSSVIGAIFSTVPAFVPQLYYSVFVLLLVFLSKNADTDVLLSLARDCLGWVIAASVFLALVYPSWVFSAWSKSWIPELPGRFAGLTAHPNAMGPLSLLYLILIFVKPHSRYWVQTTMFMASTIALILAQSKTAWLAGIAAILAVIVYRFVTWRNPRGEPSGWLALGVAGGVGALIIVIAGAFILEGLLPSGLLPYRTMSDLSTLVGRTDIWTITLAYWEKNPMFGYGPTLWSPEFRSEQLMLYVGQAHNQFVQTLGDSGIVGITGLTVYLGAIIRAARTTVSVSNGLSLALVLLLVLRCFTETPVRSMGVSDPTFLTHFVIVLALLHWHGQRRRVEVKPVHAS